MYNSCSSEILNNSKLDIFFIKVKSLIFVLSTNKYFSLSKFNLSILLISLLLSEMCVNDLSRLLELNQTTVSHQLKFLKSVGAVTSTRNNKYIFYKITDKFINSIMINGFDYILNKQII